MPAELDLALDALHHIPPDLPRPEWISVGMGLHDAGATFDDFDAWSAPASNYDERAAEAAWNSFKAGGGVGVGTLFKMAAEHGWVRPDKAAAAPRAGKAPDDAWANCTPATNDHPYIVKKGAASVPLDDLRVSPAGSPWPGALVVPVRRADGTLSTLQFIAVGQVEARLKAKGKPTKLNLHGYPLRGWHTVGKREPGGVVYIVEGIGTAWACWQATGHAAVVCFGAGNMGKVASALRTADPLARLIVVPDVGQEDRARELAAEVNGGVVTMPDGWPRNSDVSDLAQAEGIGAVTALLQDATDAPLAYPLSVVFADALPYTFDPPDELVQGVLVAGDGSVLYGDSGSGKTFLIIDLACAVALGIDWMGRRTEPGLVIYLAAESPASVRGRLQAYQKHHGVRVPDFAIVQNPIDLFDGDADTNKVIQLVRMIEAQRGKKVRLIIGDTLARMSAGANENAGQDMSLVVRRFDRIRAETGAHFLLIHHSGKNAAAGARGWSGVRAAVDVELEVTDSLAGHCCEITKQRDLPTKGERIGFRLDKVMLGLTKWNDVATSCIVVPSDVPAKQMGKRTGQAEGAILEMLRSSKVAVKRKEVVKHFSGIYHKASVYRELNKLLETGQLSEKDGRVTALPPLDGMGV